VRYGHTGPGGCVPFMSQHGNKNAVMDSKGLAQPSNELQSSRPVPACQTMSHANVLSTVPPTQSVRLVTKVCIYYKVSFGWIQS